MLKILELQKALDEKRAAFAELEKVTFEERKAELQKRVDEATEAMTAEERSALDSEIAALTAEEETHAEQLRTMQGEIDALEEEIAEEERKAPANEPKEVRKVKTNMEVRDSQAYIEAYANAIKRGDNKFAECRSLLTDNAALGTVPVPTFVYDVVKTAWNKEGIMSRVRKTFLKGNLKIGFEISGSDASLHTEGGEAVSEETLTLGVVTLIPTTIKKWVSMSDEVLDMRAEDFLNYIYDELTYRIAKKAANMLVGAIVACGTQSTTSTVAVPTVAVSAVGVGTIANAYGLLSDEAANPVIIMNKLTWSAFRDAQYAANYPVDPFEGLPVLFNDTLKSVTAATTGDAIAIVGDLGFGAIANMPNGDVIDMKYDDITGMSSDIVKILGRKPIAVAPVAPNAFATVTIE